MEWFTHLFDMLLQVDVYLLQIVHSFGSWSYAVVSSVVFVETGFVIAPFLPGDSLIFASGAFAAKGMFNGQLLFVLFLVAAILGDSVNYLIGKWCREWLTKDDHVRWINRQHVHEAKAFYEKHGAKMIVIARFVPVIRTFAPFIAGVTQMPYHTFFAYNVLGATLWVGAFLSAGYLFGNIPFVNERFSIIVVGVACISLIPLALEALKRTRADKRRKA